MFETRELVIITLLSTGLFVMSFLFGSGLVAVTGIPLMNGIVTVILFGLFLPTIMKAVPKPGTMTLALLIYSTLSLPTYLGGAPGFWPKILVNTAMGGVFDLLLWLFNYRWRALFIGFYAGIPLQIGIMLWFMVLLGLPGADKLIAFLPILIGLNYVLATIGVIAGIKLWEKKLSKNRALKTARK